MADDVLRTPDGRYIVVRGRLWRSVDPAIPQAQRAVLVCDLMKARRDVSAARRVSDATTEVDAHRRVDDAKHALGERGPVWWDDGAPDLTRHMARTTSYAEWFAAVDPAARTTGKD